MRLLVTGSRDWDDRQRISNAIQFLTFYLVIDKLIVVHGGAKGADWLAGDIAKYAGHEVEVHPADWNQYGKRAGFVRNKQMVDTNPDICYAFIKNFSKGATMCAELAQKAGIPTTYFRE